MSKIYAVVNQKGGVGKTTTVVNLSAYLAQKGARVLVVDMDPQSNATSGLGFDKNADAPSTYDLLLNARSAKDVIALHPEFGVAVVPASPGLSGAEVELVNEMAREYRLKKALARVSDQYDYILMDCPPSLSLLTINALAAAQNGVIIPVQCEYLALEGLSQLVQTVELVQQHLNPDLVIRGLLLTMYDGRTNLSRQVVEEVRKHFPGRVFRTIIPRNVRLSEAPSYGLPINHYAPDCSGAVAYRVFATELMRGDGFKV